MIQSISIQTILYTNYNFVHQDKYVGSTTYRSVKHISDKPFHANETHIMIDYQTITYLYAPSVTTT